LTLAEVKLCEVNAQRVRDALEQGVKGEEQEQQTRIEMKKAMAAAADAQRSAMDAANEARRTATIEVKRAVEAAQAEAAEAQQAGRDVRNDGDADDGGGAIKEPAPTVNLNGQTVGTHINTSA